MDESRRFGFETRAIQYEIPGRYICTGGRTKQKRVSQKSKVKGQIES